MSGAKRLSSGWGTPTPGDVLRCLEELGIKVQRLSYNEAWAYCPGHERILGRKNNKPDKWSVNIETGTHSCFSCGFSGSFVTLVQEVTGYVRSDAESWVRGRGGVQRVRRVLAASASSVEPDARLREWNEARLALFVDAPDSARDERGVSAGSLDHYGIRWSDGDDPFWVLPIRNPDNGKLWGYQEKSEDGWVSNKPYGIQKSQTLFGIDCFNSPFVLVLESPLDCAVAYSNNIFGAVSTFGVKISDAQLTLLLDLGVPIIFGMDNDTAGLESSRKIRQKFLGSGNRIKFLNYSHIPDKKDIGSGLTKNEIQRAVLDAIPLIRYRDGIHTDT
jgi:DNA primase